MSSDILLVNVHAFKGRRYFPQQIMATSHAIKQEVSNPIKHFYYVSELNNFDDLMQCIEDEKPQVVICMTDTMSISEDCLMTPKRIKERFPKTNVVMGGFMINNYPDCLTDKETTDYIWYGDAPACLPGLCNALLNGEDTADLPGIYDMETYFDDSQLVSNYTKGLEHVDLDFDIIEEPEYYVLDLEGKRAVWGVRTSLGCPFSCFFCYNSIERSYYRPYDLDKVRTWLEQLKNKWGVEQILYMDSLFFANEERAISIINMNSELGIAMNNVNMRANNMTEEVCQALYKQKDMDEVFFGSEFYDDELLKKVNKKITVKDIDKAIEVAARYPRITFVTNFIFGIPGTTKEHIRKSLDFMFETYKTVPNVAIWCCRLYLFPKTLFFKEITEQYPEYGDSVESVIRSNQLFVNDDMPWTDLPKSMTTNINVVRHLTAVYMTLNRAHWKMTKKTPFWKRMKMHFMKYIYMPTLEFRSKQFIWKHFDFEDKLVEYMYGSYITSEHNVKSIKG